ncbi:hypothetical protein A4G26_25390 [Mycobacterium kansasii]|uniref:Uncharacterized protein n=1 Tax=Mycobacterium innocens TaxID=2341083 RepID=A0A498Q825_9MYCO|nr:MULTISPECIES: hypothetical protein [Mycobacterium]KZS70713.1 hypothetical protein A4G26_25390 [Mycobacterium kansasii]VBA39950.1 hypothetical protein LAUMK13_02844 [Mycobacterium innocens]
MADDDLDTLYAVAPDAFTAERTRLAAAARQRGDATAAKRISAARKPTTAAWIVNRLVLGQRDVTQRLTDFGDGLRDAHTAMDGDRIRDLSAAQHRLISDLARIAFAAAEVKNPSSALRDDVTSTLHAAIADPGLRARLGRLTKAQRWSGFGALGDAEQLVAVTRAEKPKAEPKPARTKVARDKAAETARHCREKLNAAVAGAESAKADADAALSERSAERDAARQRRDEALADLRTAERELNSAEQRYRKAQEAGRAAADLVKEAKSQLQPDRDR